QEEEGSGVGQGG
nr:Chain B, Protein AMBP [Homo sapiens]